jgi:hypothetical protein
MRLHAQIRRAGALSAAVLASLAFATPNTHARPIDERGAPAKTLDALSEQQVLASRGQGPPRLAPPTGADRDIEWAAGAVGLACVGALPAATRRRGRSQTIRRA